MSTPQERLELLFKAVGDAGTLLILPHNDPDPDAIASAVALQHLLAECLEVKANIAYKGIVGRAENKALVRYLGYPLRSLAESDLALSIPVALVDTQPGTGNNALPATSTPTLVIDHHPWRETPITASFVDVRPEVGATSTMLAEYLQTAGIELAAPLATALFYGIKTDTMGLGRGISPADVSAYFYLQTRVDVEALVQIERAQVPAEYFKSFDAALRAARVYNGVVISYVGLMTYPDLAAELADLLLRLKGARWVICMGTHKDSLVLAVRTRKQRGAGQLVREIVGSQGSAGGHTNMAGGYIPLKGQDPEALALHLRQQVLQHLEVPPGTTGKALI
ncbi:MAG: DHH family phosphoesterase [Chloroflexi bacterium]|nr:DHH family phosphoesterase [Chloroflexota bacterium]